MAHNKRSFVVAVFLFMASRGADFSPSRHHQQKLLESIQTTSESNRPGSVYAFKNLTDKQAKVCYQRSCLNLTPRQWVLLPTDVDIRRAQKIFFFIARETSLISELSIKDNLPSLVGPGSEADENSSQKSFKLRLPKKVQRRIASNSELIKVDRIRNERVLSKVSPYKWKPFWSLPINNAVTSEFGSLRTPPGGTPYAHTGLDLRASKGTPVTSPSDGVVIDIDEQVLGGKVLTIDHGGGVMTRLLHLSAFNAKVGDIVHAGDTIAFSGDSGRVEAPHLHWEIRVSGRPVDPVSTVRLLARLANSE